MAIEDIEVRLEIGRPCVEALVWSLNRNPPLGRKSLTIREDAPFIVLVTSSAEPVFYIGDVAVSWETCIPTDDGRRIWATKFDAHVRNFVGQCPIALEVQNERIHVPFVLDVYATKLTADEVRELLGFLASRDAELLRLCFSKASLGADLVDAPATVPEIVVQAAERFIDLLLEKREYLRGHHRKRLVPQDQVVSRSAGSSMDDRGVSWILGNLDQLSDADAVRFDLQIGGRFYAAANCEHSTLINDANVYENQVLVSTIRSIHQRLSSYLQVCKPVRVHSEQSVSGYLSFSDIVSEFLPLTAPFKDRCLKVVRSAELLMRFFERELGVIASKDLKPTITPFVRSNVVYYRLFVLASAWRKTGVPSWAGREYQAQLVSVAKLYEFFCLFVILDSLRKHGFELERRGFKVFEASGSRFGTEASKPLTEPYNYYRWTRRGEVLHVYYEPKIFSRSPATPSGALFDLSHSGSGRYQYRQPDFLFVRECSESEFEYFFMDAKYSLTETVLKERLPETVRKYYLNLGVQRGKRRVTDASILGCAVTHLQRVGQVESKAALLGGRHPRFGPDGQDFVLPVFAALACSPGATSQLHGFMGRLFEEWFARAESPVVSRVPEAVRAALRINPDPGVQLR